jgi:hypothetical protein
VRLAQVVAVRLRPASQWPNHRSRVAVNVGQRRRSRVRAASPGTPPRPHSADGSGVATPMGGATPGCPGQRSVESRAWPA